MSQRITLMINNDIILALRKIQSEQLITLNKPISFSKVLNEQLAKQLGVNI